MSDHIELAVLNVYKTHMAYHWHGDLRHYEGLTTSELFKEVKHLCLEGGDVIQARLRLWKDGRLCLSHMVNQQKLSKGLNIMNGSAYYYVRGD